MQIQQFRNDGCLSYVLSDNNTKQAIIIDPNANSNEYEEYVQKNQLKVNYIIETHTHADHLSGAQILAEKYNAKIIMSNKHNEQLKVDPTTLEDEGLLDVIMNNYKIEVTQFLDDNQELQIGSINIKALHTPGHTKDSMCLLVNNKQLFTGDLILIEQVGRTDLPGGNAEQMYKSLKDKILQLPENITIYPGHDYEERETTTLQIEKKNNQFLQQNRMIDFVKLIKSMTTEEPKAGMTCGSGSKENHDHKHETEEGGEQKESMYEQMFKIILQKYTMAPPKEFLISPDKLVEELQEDRKIFLLDVRNPEEVMQYGQIGDAKNIPLQKLVTKLHELPEDDNTEIVVYCQSGMRSAIAALFLKEAFHYKSVRNLEGGFTAFMYAN